MVLYSVMVPWCHGAMVRLYGAAVAIVPFAPELLYSVALLTSAIVWWPLVLWCSWCYTSALVLWCYSA
jgi:hypothetical protein